MNVYYRALAQLANAFVALWRWATSVTEAPGYFPPVPAQHQVSLEAQAAAWAFPTPIGKLSQWADREEVEVPRVSLVKRGKLLRPFIGPLSGRSLAEWRGHPPMGAYKAAAARAVAKVVPILDELGLPVAPMADAYAATVGIFEQTVEAWGLRTGNSNVRGSGIFASA